VAGGKPLNGRELRSPFVPRSRMLTFVPPQIKILTSTAHALAPSGGSSGDYVSSRNPCRPSGMNEFRGVRLDGGTYELWFWFPLISVSVRDLLYKVVVNVHMSMRLFSYGTITLASRTV